MCYGCQQVLADLQETDGLHTAADHQRRHQVMQTAAVGPQKIYRGISVNPWSGGETSDALRELLAPGSWGQPDIDPAKLAHPDLGPALLNHVAHGNWSEWGNFRGKRPQLGRHWTTDKRIAQGFGGSGGITTVLEADHPGDVGLDPKNTGVRGRGDRSNYGHEQEVTLKPGTPLNITHVHVRHPTGWYTHDMGVSKMARAASYEVPEPWQRYYDHMSAQPDTSGNAHLMMPTDLVHHYREYDRDPADPNYQVLKKVIQEHGNQIRQPLVINADDTHGVLTEGNHRAAIARELGITHLPVRVQYGPKAQANEGTPVPHHPAFKQWLDANIGGLQRQAGANGDMPAGIRIQQLPRIQRKQQIEPWLGLKENGVHALHPDGTELGHLTWWEPDGEIAGVEVHPDYRRRGIADALLDYARSNFNPEVHHSETLTADGRAWSKQRQAGVDPEMTSLVHFTKPHIRDKIIQEQRFQQHPQGAHNDHSFFTTYDNRHDPDFRGKWGYGDVGVVVDVPSHLVKPDGDWPHPKSFMVHRDDLAGLPIRSLDRHAAEDRWDHPAEGEGFDAWRNRLWDGLAEGKTFHPNAPGSHYRAMSDEEFKAGIANGGFHTLPGNKSLFVTDDPDRLAGGAYGGKGGGHIVEFAPQETHDVSSYYVNGLNEKGVSHIPLDAVRRVWSWNGSDHHPAPY
ncbi:hypothetical protein FDH18_gp073 [Mycobacterium phage Lukilu]|uniref:N-acetyltransferase domain-containing protein n=1 Tax=Mycobacterium phage Lukilu TaxID=1913044 RepID=A0A1J0M9S1_9CAUD|nr:hypothetical protein FDH18_gp073 [Mycobacterium phage Lukilu]APD17115.1 hypothetical protein SEA_LUKILU_73 [Mycobacterium phage Lukilu]